MCLFFDHHAASSALTRCFLRLIWYDGEVGWSFEEVEVGDFWCSGQIDPSTTFFLFQKKQSWRRRSPIQPPQTPALAAIDSIMAAKSRWGPLVAAGWAHKISRGKVYTSFARANNHADQLASARPLSYRRLQQYSPAHIAAAPSRLTSSFVKQAPPLTTAADDWMVSYMIHDPLSCSDGDGGNLEEKYSRDCLALWFSYS